MTRKKPHIPRYIKRRIRNRDSENDLMQRQASYQLEQLHFKSCQLRIAYNNSIKNQRQVDSWIV